MGRLGDFGWWLREHAGGIALVLALLACGAGAAGIVIALDAKDEAEGAAAAAATSVAVTTAPAVDPALQTSVDELNERVAQIEESVSQLRTEAGATETTSPEDTTVPGTTVPPEVPKLPENLPDIPGIGAPESESPPKP
ncbi:MAG: hypothetical protein ACR2OC_03865 [Solirubrobacterales bacterium]